MFHDEDDYNQISFTIRNNNPFPIYVKIGNDTTKIPKGQEEPFSKRIHSPFYSVQFGISPNKLSSKECFIFGISQSSYNSSQTKVYRWFNLPQHLLTLSVSSVGNWLFHKFMGDELQNDYKYTDSTTYPLPNYLPTHKFGYTDNSVPKYIWHNNSDGSKEVREDKATKEFILKLINDHIEQNNISSMGTYKIPFDKDTFDTSYSGTDYRYLSRTAIGGAILVIDDTLSFTLNTNNPIGHGHISTASFENLYITDVNVPNLKVLELFDFNFFGSDYVVIATSDFAIIQAGYKEGVRNRGQIFQAEFQIKGNIDLDGVVSKYNVFNNVSLLNSHVSGAKMYRKGENKEIATSNQEGKLILNFQPKGKKDTFIVKHPGFIPITFTVDSTNYFSNLKIGMLPKEQPTDSINYYSVKVLNLGNITNKDSIKVLVNAKNCNTFSYFSTDGKLIRKSIKDNVFWKSLLSGRNNIGVFFEGKIDTVYVSKIIHKYSNKTLSNNTNKVVISSSKDYCGAKIFVGKAYEKDINDSTEEFYIKKTDEIISIEKNGYYKTVYTDIANDTVINLVLNKVVTRNDSIKINFTKQNVHYWNNITIEDKYNSSKVIAKRINYNGDFGINPISDVTEFNYVNSKSIYRTHIAYDLVEIKDNYYIAVIENDTIVSKIFPENFNSELSFEKEPQLLKINNLQLNNKSSFLIAESQPAILKNSDNIQKISTSKLDSLNYTLQYPISYFVEDPDSITNDLDLYFYELINIDSIFLNKQKDSLNIKISEKIVDNTFEFLLKAKHDNILVEGNYIFHAEKGLGIEDLLESENISIYPNPTDGIINIKFNNSEESKIRIFDLTGKEIFKYKFNKNKVEIDLSFLNNGLYLLYIKQGTSILSRKILKE